MKTQISFVSASAGSGKTHRVTETIEDRLVSGACRPGGLIATTFTERAAHELKERIRRRLFDRAANTLAERLEEGLIGTVHSVCRQLLERFAFEAGISPRIEVLDEEQAAVLLTQAVESVTDFSTLQGLQRLASRLGQQSPQTYEFNWKTQVRDIIKAVQANDLDPTELAGMADQSVAELTALLPPPATVDLDAALRSALDTALGRISANGDSTKGTQDYLQLLRDSRRDLENDGLAWSDWVKLAKAQPTKASVADALPVQAVAAQFENHPRLREDIRGYTRMLFDLAQRSMSRFRELKEERGLLDFSDLEHRALRLLRDVPAVTQALQDELDLLVVDEFQDTNPIQLGLFMALAACARETVWVGDVKQAIYGFRHSDPALVNAVVAEVSKAGGLAEPLANSYRSVPDLVRLTNALFVAPFAESLGLPEAQVRLDARRAPIEPAQSAVELLELSSGVAVKKGNKPARLTNEQLAAALAERVSQWLAAPERLRVEDRATKSVRSLRPRDMAILCRTNDQASLLAGRLAARGLPVSLVQNGLLATPEGRLSLACLRRLADPGDTLATAEIIALQATLAPEQWLEQRLDYLEQKAKTPKAAAGDLWGAEEPCLNAAIQRLEKARPGLTTTSPSEALDLALEAGEVFATVSAWGPSAARVAQRRANVESLRALARQYEEACQKSHLPATVAGFLFSCEDLAAAGEDAKGLDEQVNAIHISTYHKAKGLEWPVVVCTAFDEEPKPRLWGLTTALQDTAKQFDLGQPLANRRLRFWVWPFGRQATGIPLSARVEASPTGQAADRIARQEDLRLLYVGLTRARDRLVLAHDSARATPWLDLLGAPWLRLTGTNLELPGGGIIPVAHVTVSPPQGSASPAPEPGYAWFPPARLHAARPTARLIPSHQPALATAALGRVVDLGGRLPFTGQPDEADLGDALHAILAAEFVQPGHPSRHLAAERIIQGFGLTASVRPDDVLAMVDRFQSALEKEFRPKSVLVEVPFEVANETGQRVTGFLDMLLETDLGWIIVDHKSFPGGRADWKGKALSYSGQLSCYRDALRATSREFAGAWIHFVVGGGMVEVKVD